MSKKSIKLKHRVSIKKSIVPALSSAFMTTSALPVTSTVYAESSDQPVAITQVRSKG